MKGLGHAFANHIVREAFLILLATLLTVLAFSISAHSEHYNPKYWDLFVDYEDGTGYFVDNVTEFYADHETGELIAICDEGTFEITLENSIGYYVTVSEEK